MARNDKTFNLPFAEAEGFFRRKLNIPTDRWDDLWQGQHAHGFMVAGAKKADLLADFRSAIDKSIAGGMTLKEFQAEFDNIVARHGWSYNGGRNWRSALIYNTNVTTAYQAGRWKQFKAGGATHLMYVHSDGVMHPRPEHQALDGTVRAIDDEFWQIHYPPNGWGCQCRAVRADAEEETGVPDAAKNPNTVDPGWRYNVGKAGMEAGYGAVTRKIESLPYDIAKQLTHSWLQSPAFELFYEGKVDTQFPVAVLAPVDQAVMGAKNRVVWFSQRSRDVHLEKHPDIVLEDYQKIQKILDEGEVYPKVDGQYGRLTYLKVDGRTYIAGVKTSATKSRNYFLTLFEPDKPENKVRNLRKKERIR